MNYLSKNIRFLRKARRLSQQQLADALEVKRSNIAAYETKGVEPRLSLINEMASFFDVSLAHLITTDLSSSTVQPAPTAANDSSLLNGNLEFELNGQTATLREHAHRINQMLEGFRVFYEYKKLSPSSLTTKSDVENFLVFVKHMHNYNEAVRGLIGADQPVADKNNASAERTRGDEEVTTTSNAQRQRTSPRS